MKVYRLWLYFSIGRLTKGVWCIYISTITNCSVILWLIASTREKNFPCHLHAHHIFYCSVQCSCCWSWTSPNSSIFFYSVTLLTKCNAVGSPGILESVVSSSLLLQSFWSLLTSWLKSLVFTVALATTHWKPVLWFVIYLVCMYISLVI